VDFELIFVKEVAGAEFAVWVHEGDVTELIDISLFEMPVESFVCV
jgi:hypothetical protein